MTTAVNIVPPTEVNVPLTEAHIASTTLRKGDREVKVSMERIKDNMVRIHLPMDDDGDENFIDITLLRWDKRTRALRVETMFADDEYEVKTNKVAEDLTEGE